MDEWRNKAGNLCGPVQRVSSLDSSVHVDKGWGRGEMGPGKVECDSYSLNGE